MKTKSVLTGLKKTIAILGCCTVIFLLFNPSVLAQKNLYSSPLSAKDKASNKKTLTTAKESIVEMPNTMVPKTETGTTSEERHSLYQTETSSSLYQSSSDDNFYMEPESPGKNLGGGLYAPPPEGGNPTGGEAPVGNPGIGVLTAMCAYVLYLLRRTRKKQKANELVIDKSFAFLHPPFAK